MAERIDHIIDRLAKLEFVTVEAQNTLRMLSQERELAERIEQSIKLSPSVARPRRRESGAEGRQSVPGPRGGRASGPLVRAVAARSVKILRRCPTWIALVRNRFQVLSEATAVRYSLAIPKRVSPRFTR